MRRLLSNWGQCPLNVCAKKWITDEEPQNIIMVLFIAFSYCQSPSFQAFSPSHSIFPLLPSSFLSSFYFLWFLWDLLCFFHFSWFFRNCHCFFHLLMTFLDCHLIPNFFSRSHTERFFHIIIVRGATDLWYK